MSGASQPSAAPPEPSRLASVWMRSVEEATLYSACGWAEMRTTLSNLLAEYIAERRSEGPQVVQGLLQLAGERFAIDYVPDVPYQHELLDEPFMKSNVRQALLERLRNELTQWVNDKIASPESTPCGAARTAYSAAVQQTVLQAIPTEAKRCAMAISDVVAIGLIDVLTRNPELGYRLREFGGMQFCLPLRQHVWRLQLSTVDPADLDAQIAERVVQRSLVDRDHSQLSVLIERILSSVARDNDAIPTALWDMVKDREQVALAVLNRFQIYTGKYGARYTILLLNLMQAFPSAAPSALVAYFTSLTAQKQIENPMQWSAVSILAELGKRDPTLLAHMTSICTKSFLSEGAQGAGRGAKGLPVCVDPAAIVAKWMEHGFVGFLSKAASDFIWDQCMLFGWHCLDDVAVGMFLLLRAPIMRSTTIADIDAATMVHIADISVNALQRSFR